MKAKLWSDATNPAERKERKGATDGSINPLRSNRTIQERLDPALCQASHLGASCWQIVEQNHMDRGVERDNWPQAPKVFPPWWQGLSMRKMVCQELQPGVMSGSKCRRCAETGGRYSELPQLDLRLFGPEVEKNTSNLRPVLSSRLVPSQLKG